MKIGDKLRLRYDLPVGIGKTSVRGTREVRGLMHAASAGGNGFRMIGIYSAVISQTSGKQSV